MYSASDAQQAAYGDAQYCESIYDIDVFNTKKAESGFLSYVEKLQSVEKEFAVYDENNLLMIRYLKRCGSSIRLRLKKHCLLKTNVIHLPWILV